MLSNNHDDRPVELVRSTWRHLLNRHQQPHAREGRHDADHDPQGRDSRRRPWLPTAAVDESHPEGDVACRRQAGYRAHRARTRHFRYHRHHIVVSGGKSLIQDHFRPNPGLVEQLRADGKTAYADAVEEIGELSHRGHITYLDQHGPYGNGTPVLNAARSFGDEPVLVLWPDDVFVAEVPRAQQLIRAYEQTSCPVLALMPMTPEHSQRYGVPIVKEDLDNGLLRITGLVEKPKPEDAPSSYAAIGGYVVTPGVVDELREQTKRWYGHKTGEVYLSDALNAYAKGRAVYGQVIQGNWYDTGNPADYLVAQFASALAHPGYRPVLRRLVQEIDRPDPDGTLA